ncbi:MAG: energy transducer TonB [Calditrichaeota bacterium]|nr:energy transducer TonB [Calditrichota bacterium]
METGSKIKSVVIGARDLKGHLGRYLVQGLVVSAFLHSTFIALFGLLPKHEQITEKRYTNDTTFVNEFRPKREPTPRPKRPIEASKPDVPKFVPIEDEPIVMDSIELPDNLADLHGTTFDDGTIDTGAIYGDGLSGGGGGDAIDVAGIEKPWEKFVYTEIAPVPLDINPQPEYPKNARLASIEGTVRVWIHVGDRGDVLGWHVIDVSPPGLGFEDEVARVIPQWKFTPAIQQSNPIAVWVAMPFKFRISQ